MRVTTIKNGISFLIVVLGIFIGYKNAVIHKINNIFDILLHTTFDIAISEFHWKADIMLTINSGADVPNATIVRPITSDEI